MKEILKKLFKRDQIIPPVLIHRKFKDAFPEAINDEWSREVGTWEVVFYDDLKEKIARISKTGKLVELRTNTTLSELPDTVLQAVKRKGEIMNAIVINKAGEISWEIIYRNENLVRYLINLDPEGKEISSRQL